MIASYFHPQTNLPEAPSRQPLANPKASPGTRLLGLFFIGFFFAACQAPARVLSTKAGVDIPFEQFVTELAQYDVVFLGEIHDHGPTHRWQNEATQALHALRPNLVLSMEMWERDAQPILDSYLRGDIEEATLLEDARPWPNYATDYRPAVEWAKAHGVPVIAANCPRPKASQAYKQGLESLVGDPMVAAQIDAGPGAYFDEFKRIMEELGGHGVADAEGLQKMFEAQCVKDDTMAESIARQFQGAPEGDSPLVVHWCGRAHSDRFLGTVERVASRLPGKKLCVVSTVIAPESVPSQADQVATYLWVFPK